MAKDGYDLVLDVAPPKGRTVPFYPMSEELRGEIRGEHMQGLKLSGAMRFIGDVIPGQRMLIDTKNRHVKVIDRMTLPEHAEIDRKMREWAANSEMAIQKNWRYAKDIDIKVPERQWATWLWWIKRHVDDQAFRVVTGKNLIPEYTEIAKLGQVQLGDSCGLRPIDPHKPFYMLQPEQIQELETSVMA